MHGCRALGWLRSGLGREGRALKSLGAVEQSRQGALLSPPIPLNHISAGGTDS